MKKCKLSALLLLVVLATGCSSSNKREVSFAISQQLRNGHEEIEYSENFYTRAIIYDHGEENIDSLTYVESERLMILSSDTIIWTIDDVKEVKKLKLNKKHSYSMKITTHANIGYVNGNEYWFGPPYINLNERLKNNNNYILIELNHHHRSAHWRLK